MRLVARHAQQGGAPRFVGTGAVDDDRLADLVPISEAMGTLEPRQARPTRVRGARAGLPEEVRGTVVGSSVRAVYFWEALQKPILDGKSHKAAGGGRRGGGAVLW